jgi:hypothetical protein
MYDNVFIIAKYIAFYYSISSSSQNEASEAKERMGENVISITVCGSRTITTKITFKQ